MVRYRRLWWVTLLAVCVPAVALSLLEAPIPVLVLAVAALGAACGLALAGHDVVRQGWPEVARGVALVVVAAPVLGPLTVVLAFLAAGTSPSVVRLVVAGAGHRAVGHGRTGADGGRGEGPLPRTATCSSDAGACLEAMSGAELCEIWNQSFASVKSAADVSHRVLAARLRAGVLDELERRDAARFAAWLGRSPSPASEPRWATGAWSPPGS